MKALILEENGKLESLKVILNREIPIPKDDEVLVKIHSVGLNPSDYQTALYAGLNDSRKRVLGLEASGTIHAKGNLAQNFEVGDRVCYLRDLSNIDGCFAEYACAKAHTVSKLPPEVSFEAAAVIPSAGCTAYQAVLQKLRPVAGRTILIHGAAGGVGSFAVQLAKWKKLTVYATCSGKNAQYVRTLGADITIDYKQENVSDEIQRLTNARGVDYILNTVNSEVATTDLELLAFNGEIALTAGFPDFDRIRFFEKGISIHEIALGATFQFGDYDSQCELAVMGENLLSLLKERKITAPELTEISFEEIPDYLGKMVNGEVKGKIIAHIR